MMRLFKVLVLTKIILSMPLFASEKLILSVDLIRHGDRTPIGEIPKSPHTWKEGLGQLTEKGIKQSILLGEELRKEYAPESTEAVYFGSTNRGRTIATAKAVFKGMFPTNKNAHLVGMENTDAAKINIENDNLLLASPGWNPLSILKLYWLKHTAWKDQMKERFSQLKHWREVTGLTLESFEDLDLLTDNIVVRRLHKVPLPPHLSEEDANTIVTIGEEKMVELFRQKEMTEPMGQRFLQQVNSLFQEATSASIKTLPKPDNSKNRCKYILYFAHDSSIMSVMNTLGVPLNTVPDYLSRLNFSLMELKDGHMIVRIKFNHKLLENLHWPINSFVIK